MVGSYGHFGDERLAATAEELIARAPELMRRQFEDLFAWYGSGYLHPLVSKVYPLEQAVQALTDLKSRKATGKLVLRVRDGDSA